MVNVLQLFADWVTYSILGIAEGTPLASSVNFFVNDIIWVTLLLAVDGLRRSPLSGPSSPRRE